MFGFYSTSFGVMNRAKNSSSISMLLTVWLQQGRNTRLAWVYLYLFDIKSKGVIEAENEAHSLSKKSKQLSGV